MDKLHSIKKDMLRPISRKSRYTMAILFALMLTVALSSLAFATGETLTISFDVTQMFTWTQTIINALMPVVYVTLGISLGFLIIRALKSAFN